MSILQGFKMALKSIFSNKARSILTMLGIIIGIAAVMTLVSVVQGQNRYQREYYESLGTNKINVYAYSGWGKSAVTQDLYDFCLGLNDLVLGVTPNARAYGYMTQLHIRYLATSTESNQNYWGAEIYLGSDQYSLCNNYTIAQGRDLSYLDIQKHNNVVVIGSKLKEYLFQYRDAIGERITIGGNPFIVIGIYEQKRTQNDWEDYNLNYRAIVPYTMNRLLNNSDEMSEFTVRAKSSEATKEAMAKLEDFLSGKIDMQYGWYSVYSENQWMESSEEQNRILSYILGGIAGISLLVGGIGIMNIMLVTVRERTREIGIRKAIGGARASILMQFLIEASVVCGIGGIIGIILGYLGTLVAGKLIMNMTILPQPGLTAGAVAFSVVLGIIFGMYPAIKASGLQPVEALRAE